MGHRNVSTCQLAKYDNSLFTNLMQSLFFIILYYIILHYITLRYVTLS